jgi:glycosyltransferase involved in cell wall biosynthesis
LEPLGIGQREVPEGLRVAYVTMQFPSSFETFAGNNVRVLRGMGQDIAVHSLRPAHPEAERLLAERDLVGMPLSHFTVPGWFRGFVHGLRHPSASFDLLAWSLRVTWGNPRHLLSSLILLPRALEIFGHLKADRPDVVHLYWGHYPALVGYLVQRHLPGVALSMSLSVYDLDMNYGGSSPVAARADVVQTIAKVNVPGIARKTGVPEERIAVVYNGLDLKRVARRLEPGLSKVPGRVLSVGRLDADKAMDAVLAAFAAARLEHPGSTLVILGDGPERQALERQRDALGLQDAVTFRGQVSHDEVFREMAQAEVFLFLSKTERLPNVVKEAMLCECLCVVTATIGIEELLPDERYGYVVPIGDVVAAAERLAVALAFSEQREAQLAAARAHVLKHFDVEQAMARQVALWREALAARRADPR